jgi:hypothetical protein
MLRACQLVSPGLDEDSTAAAQANESDLRQVLERKYNARFNTGSRLKASARRAAQHPSQDKIELGTSVRRLTKRTPE